MKKLQVLLATLGTTAAWYALSNKQLRKELGAAKTPDQTTKVLVKYLGRDAKKISKEVHELMHSEEVQGGIAKAKGFAEDGIAKAKMRFGSLWTKGKQLKDAAVDSAKRAMSDQESE